ncbi:hypothetical protein HAX54_007271 [Datura stramonium]|uniref:Uncharacterized protein n=1 Tax=Datura stramonium TaxID=4076 RepID=A0ABS8TDY0_DATST|nr:hypothetical protein [Datura stramonium]
MLTDREQAWVIEDTKTLMKGSLRFVAKYWWTVVQLRLIPTQADNQLTLMELYWWLASSRYVDISKVCDEANPIAKGRSQSSIFGGSIFLDMPKGSTLIEVPALMDKGASTSADFAAIEANIPTAPSTASVSTIPPAIRPLLKPFVAKSIAAAPAPILEVIQVLHGQMDDIVERVNELLSYDDEEGIAERAPKRERYEMKKALQCYHEEMHMVGKVGASISRVVESVEHTGDYDPEGEYQTLIGVFGISVAIIDGTSIEGTTTGDVPTVPTST